MLFIDSWLTKTIEEDFHQLGRILGVYWDPESLEGLFQTPEERLVSKREASKDSTVFYPLAFLIEPKFIDILKKSTTRRYGINAPQWAKDAGAHGEMDNMFEWDVEKFMGFVSSVVDKVAPSRKQR